MPGVHLQTLIKSISGTPRFTAGRLVSISSPALRRAVFRGLVAGVSALAAALPAQADLAAPRGSRSLGTVINGSRSGRCASGLCVVGGGTAAGNNLFHRLKAFDTRGEITGVRFDNQRGQTVVVGVTSPWGSWIDKAIAFSKPGNLLLLSPGGIQLSTGAIFLNVGQLGLSTATRLAMQGGGASMCSAVRHWRRLPWQARHC